MLVRSSSKKYIVPSLEAMKNDAGFEFLNRVCLSKGLGAPVGSAIVGSKSFISKAKRLRKTLGGGMRQVGILCAAFVALQENVPKLEGDHRKAKILAGLHLNSNGQIGAEFLLKNDKVINESLKSKTEDSIMEKYGNATPDEELLRELLLGQASALLPRKKYEEDVYINNHTTVWGSRWKDNQWVTSAASKQLGIATVQVQLELGSQVLQANNCFCS